MQLLAHSYTSLLTYKMTHIYKEANSAIDLMAIYVINYTRITFSIVISKLSLNFLYIYF